MVLLPIIGRIALFLDQVSFPSLKICRIEQVDESSTFKNKTNCPRCFTHHVDNHYVHLFIILKLLRPFTYCLLSMIPSVDGFLI